jgi:hypothetical protein
MLPELPLHKHVCQENVLTNTLEKKKKTVKKIKIIAFHGIEIKGL